MKKFAVYNFKGAIQLNEESILAKTVNTLTKEQTTLVSFDPLFDETFIQDVNGYQVAKMRFTSRKEPDKTILSEQVDSYLETIDLPQDESSYQQLCNAVQEEKRLELMQYTGYTSKAAIVAVDNSTGKVVIAEARNFADMIMGDLLSCFEGDYSELELLSTEPVATETILTDFLLDERKNLPDPFTLVEKVSLGKKSVLDKKPSSATIKVSKTYPAVDEILSLVTDLGNVVKDLELEFDGILCFNVTNTLSIESVKFLEDLKFKPDEDTSDSVNFLTQYQLQLPVVFDVINRLEEVIVK